MSLSSDGSPCREPSRPIGHKKATILLSPRPRRSMSRCAFIVSAYNVRTDSAINVSARRTRRHRFDRDQVAHGFCVCRRALKMGNIDAGDWIKGSHEPSELTNVQSSNERSQAITRSTALHWLASASAFSLAHKTFCQLPTRTTTGSMQTRQDMH